MLHEFTNNRNLADVLYVNIASNPGPVGLTNEWKPELVLDERHVERRPEEHEGDGVGVLQLGVVHDGRDHKEDGEHQHYDRHHDWDLHVHQGTRFICSMQEIFKRWQNPS